DGTVDVFAPERERVFSDGVAYEVTRILEDNVRSGTGGNANIGVPVAGKTGTTDDFVDAWFVGYTPRYSTAVWVGYPNSEGERRSMTSVHGITVQGGSFPAMIWGDFMRVVVERDGGSEDWEEPRDPVEWSPFSSQFTRAAGAARRAAEAAAASPPPTATTTTEEEPQTAPTTPRRPATPAPAPAP